MLEYVDSDAMDWLTNQVDIDWPHKPTSQTNNPTSHNNINIQQHHVEVQVKVKVTDQEESWQWLLWLYFHGKSAHCTNSSMQNKNHQSFWRYQYSLENHCTEQKPMFLYEFWKIWVRHHFVYFFGLRVGNYGFILWHWGCEVNLMAVKTQELIELHFSWINYEIESTKFKESIENILPRIINKLLWLLPYYPVLRKL